MSKPDRPRKSLGEDRNMTYRTAIRFAAVTVLTAAAAFSADWSIQQAKIPFEFKAGSAVMPAGSYRVSRDVNRAVPVLTFVNVETKQAAIVMAPVVVKGDTTLEGNRAQLMFECAGTECAFRELQPGYGQQGYRTLTPKFRSDMGYNNTEKPEVSRRVVTATVKAD
jgi:hypothetical protein